MLVGALTVPLLAWGLGLMSRAGVLRTHRFAMATDGSRVWAVNQMRSLGWRRSNWQCIDFLLEDANPARRERFAADIGGSREYGEDPKAGMRRVRPKFAPVAVDRRGRPIDTNEYAIGFPWPALWCELYDESGTLPPNQLGWCGGVPLWAPITGGLRSNTELGALPYRPYWPGLLGDVGVWTGVWMGALVGLPGWRRRRRRRCGQCQRCGYDLRGAVHQGCPECGWNRLASSADGEN